VSRNLSNVSRDLTRLASDAPAGGQALHDLAAKLGGRGRSDLAGVDLAGIYAPAVMLPDGPRWLRRTANGLELIRDVLIFVPVIYTWWQLSDALHAYDRYTGKAPFLLAWQEGFGGRTQRLSTSAIVVAGVVLAVVALTLIAHLVRTWYDQKVQHRQQGLAILLAEASILLNEELVAGAPDVTKAELAKIGVSITSSAHSLQEALAKTGADIAAAVNTGPGSGLRTMFEQWTAAANELKTLGTRLQGTQEIVNQLRETQTALTGMATKIGDETGRLLTAFEQERTLSRQEAHAHHDLATEVGASTRQLSDSLRGLSERAEDFNDMVHRLTYVVNRLDPNGNQGMDPGDGYN
jgi:hypothetical protein